MKTHIHYMEFKRLDTGEILQVASRIGDSKEIRLVAHVWENGRLSFKRIPVKVIQHGERQEET